MPAAQTEQNRVSSYELRKQIARKTFERIGGPTPKNPDNVIVVDDHEWTKEAS